MGRLMGLLLQLGLVGLLLRGGPLLRRLPLLLGPQLLLPAL